MTSKVQDYSQKLADVRTRYNESKKTLRDNYTSDLDNTQKAHKLKQEKQAAVYKGELRSLERENEDRVTKYADKTQSVLKSKNQKFADAMRKESARHDADSNILRTNLSDKLSKIQNSYELSTKERNRQHSYDMNRQKEGLQNRIDVNSSDFARQIKNNEEQNSISFNSYKDTQNKEKQKIISGYEKELEDGVKDSKFLKESSQTKNQKDMEKLRAAHKEGRGQMMNHYEDKLVGIKDSAALKAQRLTDNFTELNDSIQGKAEKDKRKQSTEHKLLVNDVSKRYAKNLRVEKRRAATLTAQSSSSEGTKLKEEREQRSFDKRIQNLKNDIDTINFNNAESQSAANDASLMRLNKQARTFNDKIETIEGQAAGDMGKIHSKYREERENREEVNNISKLKKEKEYEALNSKERKNFKDLLKNQKEEFAYQVNELTKKNIETVSSLQEIQAEDKTEVIESMKKKNYSRVEELKDHFNGDLIKRTASFEERMQKSEAEKESLVKAFDKKFDNFRKKAMKELAEQKKISAEQSVEDRRASKRKMAALNAGNIKTLNGIQREFDKKISTMKNENELKMMKLRSSFETEVITANKEHKKDLKLKLNLARRDYESLFNTSQLQLENQKNQYESKLEQLRQDNYAQVQKQAETEAKLTREMDA